MIQREREFDVVSNLYIGQTKPGGLKVNARVRQQIRATFEMADETNRVPYFHFDGAPHSDVLRVIKRYEREYQFKAVVDLVPFGG